MIRNTSDECFAEGEERWLRKNSRYYVLEDLRPGMVVAKEVLSPTDQVILSEGTELTDKLIVSALLGDKGGGDSDVI